QGKIAAFVMRDGERVEVARHGPGTIIGEVCLALDDPIQMSFEALVDTTVVTITRQDFEKKLTRVDQTIKRSSATLSANCTSRTASRSKMPEKRPRSTMTPSKL